MFRSSDKFHLYKNGRKVGMDIRWRPQNIHDLLDITFPPLGKCFSLKESSGAGWSWDMERRKPWCTRDFSHLWELGELAGFEQLTFSLDKLWPNWPLMASTDQSIKFEVSHALFLDVARVLFLCPCDQSTLHGRRNQSTIPEKKLPKNAWGYFWTGGNLEQEQRGIYRQTMYNVILHCILRCCIEYCAIAETVMEQDQNLAFVSPVVVENLSANGNQEKRESWKSESWKIRIVKKKEIKDDFAAIHFLSGEV